MKKKLSIALALLLSAGIINLWGQSSQIGGVVKDPSGAVIPGVELTITNTDTNISRSVLSTENGSYTVSNLVPGPYKIHAELPGFVSYNQSGIVIQVASNPNINITLQVGAVTDVIEVSADAAMVETRSNAIGQVIDQVRVVELPLNGRQITDLASLTGGTTNMAVVMTSAGTSVGSALVPNRNYPTDAAISVAGGGGNKTNYLLDGTANVDLVTGAGLPFPFPDALQEFKLETSSLPASAGQLPGGVVNVVTKAGTNTFHGGAFEFLRNYAVNARNAFAATTDGLKRNQFGGYLGGPIVKNKLFFFGGYQGTREAVAPASYVTFVPNAQVLQGDFTSVASPACNANRQLNLGVPYVNNKLDPNLISPIAKKILALIPVSTDPCGKITYSIPVHDTENQEVAKVDYTINAKQSVFARYFITNYSHPPAFDGKNLLLMSKDASVGLGDRVQTASIGHTYIFNPSTINSFHIGFSRSIVTRQATPGAPTWQELGAGVYSPIKGYFNLSVTNYLGSNSPFCGNCSPGPWASTTYQINDDFSTIRGRHQIAFGFHVWQLRENAQGNIRTSGSFAFGNTLTGNGLANFMAGLSTSYTQNAGQYISERFTGPSTYIQDNFRVNNRLTINAGVRWDPLKPIRFNTPQVSLFDPAWYAAGIKSTVFSNGPTGVMFSGDPGMPDNNNRFFGRNKQFAPRLGFVYDPRGDGQETIRAGFGMFYDTVSLGRDQNTSNPWAFSVSIPNPTSMLNPFAGSVYGSNPYPTPAKFPADYVFPQFGGGFSSWIPHLKAAYVEQWNLALQKQLPDNWLVSATYLGNHSVHLPVSQSFNPTVYVPGNCVAGQYGLTSAGACSTTGNVNYRGLLYIQDPLKAFALGGQSWDGDGGTANYNGLVTSIQHRFSQNYSILVNDTWSHCLNSGTSQDPNVRETTACGGGGGAGGAGNTSVDLRNSFNLSSVINSPKFSSKVMQVVAGNWKESTIFTKHTGPYSSVTTGLNVPGTGTRPNYVPGVSPTVDNPTTAKWFNTAAFVAPNLACTNGGKVGPAYLGSQCDGTVGTNTIQGPGAWNVDMSLSRNISVPFTGDQGMNFAIRIEAFNVFNHTRLAPPDTSMSSATFGQILFANSPRILQGSLKMTF